MEYVLLLALAFGISALIMQQVIGTTDNPQGIRKTWTRLIQAIANDRPDVP